MLAFTIILISLYIFIQVTMSLAKNTQKNFNNEEITKEAYTTTMGFYGCGMLLVGFPFILAEYIYYLYALRIDPLTFPTWIMVAWLTISLLIPWSKKLFEKEVKFEVSITKVSWSGYIDKVLTILYFAYMLYILIVGI